MLETYGPSAMILDLNMLCFHEYNVFFDLIYKLYTLAIVWNPRPQGDSLRYRRGWILVRGSHVSTVC